MRVVRAARSRSAGRLRKPARQSITQEERAIDLDSFPSFLNISSKTGVVVTPQTSLQYSTVFSCVDLIASTISIIPINIFKEEAGGKFPATEHDQYYLIRKEPHRMYSRLQWTKMMIVHYLLWGDGVSIIQRNKFGRPIGYLLQMPWDVTIDKLKDTVTGETRLWYKIDGVVFPAEDVIHFSDLSIDGKKGCGRIQQNRESIGLGMALRDYGNELISTGGKTMGYIHGDKRMTPDAYRLLTEKFLSGYGGESSVGVLPHGWKYTAFEHPLPPASAEYMASKSFSAEEVCTIFRTPPLLIGLTKGVNNSVAESIMRTWLMSTIAPITTMMEFEWDRKAFRETEKPTHYVKYNLWALDKADMEKTMKALVDGVNNGLINKDEARQTLDRNPIPGGLGKEFNQPINIAPIDVVREYLSNNTEKNDGNKE
jgi:HK97 family phage portal protein